MGPRVGNLFGPNIPEVIRDPELDTFLDRTSVRSLGTLRWTPFWTKQKKIEKEIWKKKCLKKNFEEFFFEKLNFWEKNLETNLEFFFEENKFWKKYLEKKIKIKLKEKKSDKILKKKIWKTKILKTKNIEN